jgi:hypothetical protein
LFKKRLSIPETAHIIYVSSNELLTSITMLLAKGFSVLLLVGTAWMAYNGNLEEETFKEIFKLKEDIEYFYFKVAFFIGWLLTVLSVAYKYQKVFVLRLFYDDVLGQYYLVYLNNFFKPSVLKFTKNNIRYRFDPAVSKTKVKGTFDFITKKYGNFYVNKKLFIIEPKCIVPTQVLDEMLGERVANVIKAEYRINR